MIHSSPAIIRIKKKSTPIVIENARPKYPKTTNAGSTIPSRKISWRPKMKSRIAKAAKIRRNAGQALLSEALGIMALLIAKIR
jgi:hypothetical protein